MLKRIPSLNKLVHALGKLPGIGPKSALRLAFYLLKSSREEIDELKEALVAIKENIKLCSSCFSYTENEEICYICSDLHRRDDLLCVVQQSSDIPQIETSGVFRGRYHVLHGSLSPLEGVHPKDLKIKSLLIRIETSLHTDSPVTEVILALDANLEGDTTSLYLAKLLQERNIKVTRIAHGVPIGGNIDYIDHRTLGKALENRVTL